MTVTTPVMWSNKLLVRWVSFISKSNINQGFDEFSLKNK